MDTADDDPDSDKDDVESEVDFPEINDGRHGHPVVTPSWPAVAGSVRSSPVSSGCRQLPDRHPDLSLEDIEAGQLRPSGFIHVKIATHLNHDGLHPRLPTIKL